MNLTRNQIIGLSLGSAAAVLLIGGIVIASSGGDGDDEDAAPVTTAAAPATTVPETTTTSSTTTTVPKTPVLRQPLTGEVVEKKADLVERPALVVKIDNAPAARPNHSGLAVADLVFEEIVEGSITRFAAVFHTNDSDPVGPIRSGRTQDVLLFESFNQPLFAWSGGNPGVTRAIAESSLTDLNWQNYTGSYYRGPGATPHNLYSSTQALWGLTPPDHPGAPEQQYRYVKPGDEFEASKDYVDQEVTHVDVQMRGIAVDWDWNPETGKYERSQAGSAHIDTTHGRIDATNVIVMGVDYQPSYVDARSPEAQTIGTGPVMVFSDGKLKRGIWVRAEVHKPIEFRLSNGKDPILLAPGNSWIELAERSPDPEADWGGIPIAVEFAEEQPSD